MITRRDAVSPDDSDRSLDVNAEDKVVTGAEGEGEIVDMDKEARENEKPDEFMCRECNPNEDQEAEIMKTARSPSEPSQAEREEHNLTHCKFRSWCDPCVKGQAKDDAHGTVQGEYAESSIPRVTMDYAFLTENVKAKEDEFTEEVKAKVSMTILVLVESMCRSVWTYAVESKGASENWLGEQILEDFDTIGLTNERLIIKADQEPAITEVQRMLVKSRAGHGTAMEQSRVGDSNSNGRVERAVQDVKGLVRTYRAALEENIGEKINLSDSIVPWMVRHAGHIITRCRIRENGRTAFQMMKGRRSTAKLVPFGECILFKIPKTQHKVGDFEDRWEAGVWVGFIMRSGEHLVATGKGVFRVSTVMRRPPGRRWSADMIKKIVGSPKDPVPGSSLRRIPAFAKKFEDEKGEKATFVPAKDADPEVRVAYIYKGDIEKHGPTTGCAGCKAAMSGSKYRAKHSEECRKRMEELIGQDPEGKQRFESAVQRRLEGIAKIAQKMEENGEVDVNKDKATENKVDVKPAASAGSGSGLSTEDRKRSVDAENQRELERAIKVSKKDVNVNMEAEVDEPQRPKRKADEPADDSARGDPQPEDSQQAPAGTVAKRVAEIEDSIMGQEGHESGEFGPHGHVAPQTPTMEMDSVQNDNPGPIGKYCKEDLEWVDIGSGTFAKTFPQATWLRTTSRGGPPLQDVHRRIVRSLRTGKIIDDCIVDDVKDDVLNRRLHKPEDVRVELIMKDAMRMYAVKGPDVVEIFSQPRVAQEAAMRPYDGARLVPGWSLDLTREDPETGKPWDLGKHQVREKVRKMIRQCKPYLVIGSPPCTLFSSMQNMNEGKRRNQEEHGAMMKAAKGHIKFCTELYRMQMSEHRYFLHEHPCTATSWRMPEIVKLMGEFEVDTEICDMCAYGMKITDQHGEALAEKKTRVMSNSAEVLKRLNKKCSNRNGHETKHRHADTTGGKVKLCQVYPRAFCRAICEGIAAQKRLDSLGLVARPLMSVEEMHEVMLHVGDPSKDLHEDDPQIGVEAFDDLTGATLNPELVAKARQEEIEYFKQMGVYIKVGVDECWAVTGKKPIAVRWIDINKGDEARPNYRSRLVAKEFRTNVNPELYAATPPSECLRMMLSKLATDKNLELMYADVSRAYFYAKAVRSVYIDLPEEDRKDGEQMQCGKLKMSMYGTRDAAVNWAMEYAETLRKSGFDQGRANTCLFYNSTTKVSIMVHGDDFVAVGHPKHLKKTREMMENKYKLKVETLGNAKECKKEIKILNKIVRYEEHGVELEADPRHAELVVKELGLTDAKSSRVPGVKEVKQKDANGDEQHKGIEKIQVLDEEAYELDEGYDAEESDVETEAVGDGEELLDANAARKYRAITARLNYMAVDRVDIQYAVKEAARSMANPKVSDWPKLVKIGRYLLGRPRLVMEFPWQVEQGTVTAYSDSDWAGCPRTARSTSGGIIMLGEHVIKTYSRQQKVVALSSAEAELYAMVAASAEALAIIAYAKDLGMTVNGEVYTDSSAALGISQRAGIGKVRHLRTQGLWVQETRMTGRLAYRKVLGSKNPADVLTKHVAADLLNRHLETIGAKIADGRAGSAPQLNSVESWVEWFTVKPERHVQFEKVVSYRAIPSNNKGKKCSRSSARIKWHEARTPRGSTTRKAGQWADWTDEEDDERRREALECEVGLRQAGN